MVTSSRKLLANLNQKWKRRSEAKMKAKEILLVIRCHTVEDAEAIAKFVSERAEKKMLEKVKT